MYAHVGRAIQVEIDKVGMSEEHQSLLTAHLSQHIGHIHAHIEVVIKVSAHKTRGDMYDETNV